MRIDRTPQFRIFLPLFLLLLATSAISSTAAAEAFTSGGSAVASTLVAILASVVVCALASVLVSRSIVEASGRLAASMADASHAAHPARGLAQSAIFAEVAAACDTATMRWERILDQEKLQALRSRQDLDEFLCTVAKASEERTPFLRGHAECVAAYSVGIAEEFALGEELTGRIRLAAMVHDIGMIGIGEPVHNKGRLLGAREFDILRAHPSRGAAILRSIESLRDLVPAVELHHEAPDGSGYPYGLPEDEIPLAARILAVADTFDTLVRAASNQAGMELGEAVDVLIDLSGTRLDGKVVDAFLRFLNRSAVLAPTLAAVTAGACGVEAAGGGVARR